MQHKKNLIKIFFFFETFINTPLSLLQPLIVLCKNKDFVRELKQPWPEIKQNAITFFDLNGSWRPKLVHLFYFKWKNTSRGQKQILDINI